MDRWVMSKILLLIEFWSDDRDWLNKEMDDDQVMKQCLPLVLFKLLGKFCDNVVKVFVFKMDTAAKVRSATRMMPRRRRRGGAHHGGFAQLRVRGRLPRESLCGGGDAAVNYSCLITPVNNLALNYLGIYFVNYDN